MLSVIPKIWTPIAPQNNGYNLFLKTNAKAFDPSGLLTDPAMICISTGKLLFPEDFEVTYNKANQSLQFSWSHHSDPELANGNDELCTLIVCNLESYQYWEDRGIKRSARQGILKLSPEEAKAAGIYFFFHNSDKTQFSPSRYFSLSTIPVAD